jgi:hypothetical protein
MKYINKLNIDFDNWGDIPMNINEQQIKELHPIFYKFLKEKKLMNIYLEMFDKCRWKHKGNNFEEIIDHYKNIGNTYDLFNYIIDYTLDYHCVRLNSLFNDISLLNNEFNSYYKKNK